MPTEIVYFIQKPILWLMSLLLGLTWACSPYPDFSQAKASDEIPSEETAQVHNPSPIIRNHFEIELIGESQAKRYSAVLEWDFNSQTRVEIYRTDLNQQREHFVGRFDNHSTYTDSGLLSEQEFIYLIKTIEGQTLERKQIKIPKDLLIQNTAKIPEDYTSYQRLFLEENSVLVTNGEDIFWKLNEIRASKGAKVVSFLENHEAPVGQNGRHSGNLTIFANFLEGEVSFEWRGQKGGEGQQAKPNPQSGARGANGSDGRSGMVGGREGGFECIIRPTNGKHGAAGPQGFKGHDGHKGGDVLDLNVVIQQKSLNSRVFMSFHAGKGGKGGKGGLGGAGGRGGKAGSGGGDCPSASDGRNGPQGPSGPQGNTGVEGKVTGDICVQIEEQIVQGSCSR